MYRRLQYLPEGTLVVPIPTATERVRERGYDQARLLAKAVAARHNLLYMPLLLRVSQKRQLGAARSERFKNMAGAFRINGRTSPGTHILLIDDVVTTGATLAEAARLLRADGAAHVDAATFAQTML